MNRNVSLRLVYALVFAGILCSAWSPGFAQSSSQDSLFSSGVSQQQTSSTNQSGPDVTTTAPQTQVGPKVLTQSQQTTLQNGLQQNNEMLTERNGRVTNQNPYEPVPLTAFQRLVAASVGKVLPVF